MIRVAAAVVRRGEAVLLVRQQGPDDERAHWTLPGGVVEPGETVTEALARELREETGLALLDPGRLLYTAQITGDDGSSIAYVYETEAAAGELRCNDPDGLVKQAEFVVPAEAIERLAALPWRNMGEPVIAYWRGEARVGAEWTYRRVGGEVVLDGMQAP